VLARKCLAQDQSALSSLLGRARLWPLRACISLSKQQIGYALELALLFPASSVGSVLAQLGHLLCYAALALRGLWLALCSALNWCRRLQMPGPMAQCPRARLKPRPHATNRASKRPKPVVIIKRVDLGRLLFAERPGSERARQALRTGGIRDACESITTGFAKGEFVECCL